MDNLERAFQATRSLLEDYKATVDPSGTKKHRRPLRVVLYVLNDSLYSGRAREFIGDLKDVTDQIFVCQQNNKRAFNLVWNLYVVAQQWTGHRSSFDNIGNIQDRVGQALDSVLHAFHIHPFSVSPEGDIRVNLPTFAVLNHNHETATRHEMLARSTGKAWVDDCVRRFNPQVLDIGALKNSLFGLLWSGTLEQLRQHNVYSDSLEQQGFERAMEELEKVLQDVIIRSKKQRSVIAFCGMVKAGKSTFLNALIGRSILPSHGRSVDFPMPYPTLSTTAEFPCTVWPCRLRHVEGQTVPELQYQAEPFLIALKKLQEHQYGQSLRWLDLHAVTRDNLLKFETPGFELPRMATGEENVKILVSVMTLCTVLFSTE